MVDSVGLRVKIPFYPVSCDAYAFTAPGLSALSAAPDSGSGLKTSRGDGACPVKRGISLKFWRRVD